jgi:thiol-disulfide isomerase/thioredoxin
MKYIYLCTLPLLLWIKPVLQKNAPASPVPGSRRAAVKRLSNSPFPIFRYPDTAGKKYCLNDLQGKKATLVVFWASWCAPCRKEIPALKEFYGEYSRKGISIVSISVDQNIRAWKKAVKEEKMPWTNLANLPADDHPTMELFGINGVPAMFLLDTAGQIILADPSFEQVKSRVKTL